MIHMKIISFNANGIRSAERKGFFTWMAEQCPDIVCIQETKAQSQDLKNLSPSFCPDGYYCEYVDAQKKGYSGVAIYAKKQPLNIIKSMGFDLCDQEGRYLQFDYEHWGVISVYLPSGTSGDERQAAKYEFLKQFEQHLESLRSTGREYIVCGDFNIAHKAIDLKNWRGNQKNSGFLPEERAWMDKLLGSMQYCDAFRVVNTNSDEYTWWSNRGQAWAKNVGWRIDYQIITEGLRTKVTKAEIYRDVRFSDHAPLIIEYNIF